MLFRSLTKLIAAYESKKFLAEQVSLMIQSIEFDAEKFIGFMRDLSEKVFDEKNFAKHKKFLGAVVDAAFRVSDKKIFVAAHSSFFENFLVNELFLSTFPWKFDGSLSQNFAAFVTKYKLFELITFSMLLRGFTGKKDLIESATWFTTRFDHTQEYKDKIFSLVKDTDDPFSLMDSLLEGGD